MNNFCIFYSVFNERNLHRIFDIAYDGYIAGKDAQILNWTTQKHIDNFKDAMSDLSKPYEGPSIVVLPITTKMEWLPSPLVICDEPAASSSTTTATPEFQVNSIKNFRNNILNRVSNDSLVAELKEIISQTYSRLGMHAEGSQAKMASDATVNNEATGTRLAYQGTSTWTTGKQEFKQQGCGHHGPDYVGVAAVRNGKALMPQANPTVNAIKLSGA